MAKNDFKAFATDRNANVMSQEEWEALPALLQGHKGTGHYHREGGMVFLSALLLQSA